MIEQRVDMICQALDAFCEQNCQRLAEFCQQMARRFQQGGRLLVLAEPGLESDAAHVTVEFMHPVITGKRALPALQVQPEDLSLASPSDILLGLAWRPEASWRRALKGGSEHGLLVLGLTAELEDELCLASRSQDPMVNQEVLETAYHLLWELVHVFLEGV